MIKVVIRPLARADLKNIWRYTFENWGVIQADIYTTALGEAINGLKRNSEIGRCIDEIQPDYRIYQSKQHLIVYRIKKTEIEISRILGKKMDVIKQFSK